MRKMRKDHKPTIEQLKELYQAASDFKQVQPWKWFYDVDIICVENPKDKVMGYCSIMGRLGEYYALGVYLGDDGLYGFSELMKKGDNMPPHQALHYQDCLMCSFEDRDQLSNADRKQIKDLGLSFRGRNAWPMFRRFEPGYEPWYINKEECIFLTHALRQTLFVANNVMNGKLKMDMEHGITILRYSKEKDGKLEWYSKELELDYLMAMYNPVIINDEVLINRVKKSEKMGNISLEIDICYLPFTIHENKGERPYFPRCFIIVEKKSGIVMDFEMYQDTIDDVDVTINKLVAMFLERGMPKEIHVRNDAMVATLDDFCKKTGIKLSKVNELSGVDRMIEEMSCRFG